LGLQVNAAFAQKKILMTGQVMDSQKKPLAFVTIQSDDLSFSTYTNDKGFFEISVDTIRHKSFNLNIRMVGKKTIETFFSSKSNFKNLKFTLLDLNLSLNEIEVSEVRKAKSSNSSILFDRQAIEQIQAFSLTDILNNLPGKTVTPPRLQNPTSITLRSEATGLHALNNALGIAIIMDDIQLSNNANMQNRNVGKFGVASSGIQSRYKGGFDVAFGGLDLREIVVDNIESIEVVSGVAPAKYGDLTDGAVIINRQADATKYQFSSRINDGSTNFSLSKGYPLGKKAGALNFSLNYLFSEEDPSDPIKSYKRVSSGLMWTSYLFKDFKNTLSLDYNTRLDDVKRDPDVGEELMTFAKSRNISISNRSSLNINSQVLKSINMSIGYTKGYQETYNQRLFNNAPKPVADKDTIGMYVGYYTPGTYISVEHLLGKPGNLNGNLSLNGEFTTGHLVHRLSIGTNVYFSDNKGQGVVVDPNLPRWANDGYQNERPYSYDLLPSIFNFGIYVQDNFDFELFNNPFKVNAGLRYDNQNGSVNLQPRINANYSLSKKTTLNLAFGTSSKAPTLSHRYPGPIFFDLPLLNVYNSSDVSKSMFLVYTDKVIPDNSAMVASKSSQIEFGLSYKDSFFDSSIFGYYKTNKDGFSNINNFKTYTTAQYDYVLGPDGVPGYVNNGKIRNWITSYFSSGNSLSSENIGLEWFISTKKVKKIETSFSLNTSFSYSTSKNNTISISKAKDTYITDDYKAWFGVYKPTEVEDYSIVSKLTTSTHIPKLGFVISVLADVFWQSQRRTLHKAYLPIAYLDKNMQRYEIPVYDQNDPTYNYLALQTAATDRSQQPFIYTNISLRVAKDIGKAMRMSVNAYNVFNIRNRYYNNATNTVISYTYPVSVSADLSIKF
jgi:ferric enterobactin receptor